MPGRSAADILSDSNKLDGTNIKEFKGQTLTVTSFTSSPSSKYPGRTFVDFEAVTSSGDTVSVFTSAIAILRQLNEFEANDLFPVEVKVVTYDTDKGNPGFKFGNPEA